MGKERNWFVWFFTAALFACVLFLIWYIPSRAERDFQLKDITLSVETSHGRERKQQAEYDEVTTELPRVREALAKTQPEADAALAEANELKAERKKLREEKARLEEALDAAPEEPGEAGKDE